MIWVKRQIASINDFNNLQDSLLLNEKNDAGNSFD